jgi:arabinofuranosyltransferase
MRKIIPYLLVAVALVARFIPGPRTIDDSYITFRYARNLVSGNGFVFNPPAPGAGPGERVQGTTTPLYTLLMAGLALPLGGAAAPFPAMALAVNALADAATCLLLWQIGRRLGAEWAGLAAALVWAVAPYSVTFAIGGLETSLYVLLLTGMVAAYLWKKRTLTTLCAALALLTRPDAILLVAPLALDRLWRAFRKGSAERLEMGEVLAFLLPCLAWGIFATAYFGSPIPHSVTAKLAVYRLEDNAALIRLIQHYATPFMEYDAIGVAGIGIGLILYPFLYLVGARRAWRSQPRLLAWLVYPWLYFVVFAIPNPLLFRWYLTPPLPAYFLVILLGAEQVLRSLFRKKRNRDEGDGENGGWRVWVPLVLLVALPLAGMLNAWSLHPDHGPDRPAPAMAWFKLELLYRQAADYLAPRLTPASRLAAGDVGVLGFYTPARILDTVGLNSPESLTYYPLDKQYYVINYAIPAGLILDQKPDYVVILEVYARLTLLQDAQFSQEYTLLRTLPTDIYGSRGMLIFARNP